MNTIKKLLALVITLLMVLGGLLLFYPSFYFLAGSDEGAWKIIGVLSIVLTILCGIEAVRQGSIRKNTLK